MAFQLHHRQRFAKHGTRRGAGYAETPNWVLQKRVLQNGLLVLAFAICLGHGATRLAYAGDASADQVTEQQQDSGERQDSDERLELSRRRSSDSSSGLSGRYSQTQNSQTQSVAGYSRIRPPRSREFPSSRPARTVEPRDLEERDSDRPTSRHVPNDRDPEFDATESPAVGASERQPELTHRRPAVRDFSDRNQLKTGAPKRDSIELQPEDHPFRTGSPDHEPAEDVSRAAPSKPHEDGRDTSEPQSRFIRRSPRNSGVSQRESSEPGTDSPGLVPDDGGPVAEILLHYSVTSEMELGAIYRDLFQHLGPTTKLQVCCPNEQSADAFASRWGQAAVGQGRSVHVINVNRPITVWARDRRICRQSADGQPASCFVPTAHATYDPEKQNDLVLPSLLWSTGLVPPVALTSMHLEGGNVVSNRRHVFVGSNAFEDNEFRFESEESLFTELGRLFGRETVAIAGLDGGVPWIHTDMYLTPIDSKTILVASPVLGCDLIPNRKSVPAVNRGKPVALEFDAITPDSTRQQRFDDVAKQLTVLGYQVIRMPALINVQKDWMVTYNNVIMDYQEGQRVVYMPVYNIPELDETASQTYRALGFDVKPIDVSAIFQLGGAIRCLANVTRRLPLESRLQTRTADANGRLQVYSVDPSANRSREIRQRWEKRPSANPARERIDGPFRERRDLSARETSQPRENSYTGMSVFGQPVRNSIPRDLAGRDAGLRDNGSREVGERNRETPQRPDRDSVDEENAPSAREHSAREQSAREHSGSYHPDRELAPDAGQADNPPGPRELDHERSGGYERTTGHDRTNGHGNERVIPRERTRELDEGSTNDLDESLPVRRFRPVSKRPDTVGRRPVDSELSGN